MEFAVVAGAARPQARRGAAGAADEAMNNGIFSHRDIL
jgi:hypothetical protein